MAIGVDVLFGPGHAVGRRVDNQGAAKRVGPGCPTVMGGQVLRRCSVELKGGGQDVVDTNRVTRLVIA